MTERRKRYFTDKSHTLIGSLKLSLTFWLMAGFVVWLAISIKNELYTVDGDVLKIFIATSLWYGVLGLIFWLPVWIGGWVLKGISVLGKNEYGLQLGLHWFVAVMLTYFFQLHRVWLPYTPALSLQGVLVTLLLVLFGMVTAWLVVLIARAFSRLSLFQNYIRTLIACFVLIVLGYAVSGAYSGIRARSQAGIPPDLNRVDPTGAKAILIGFDGATWEAINPLMEKGLMPNFTRFLEEGFGAPLQSDKPTLSAILWTTVATGKTAKGHGVTEIVSTITPGLRQNVLNYPHLLGCDLFVQLLMKRGVFYVTPLSSSARHTKAVWNILSDYDKRVGVVGWWGSYPPEEVNGVIVSDHASMAKTEMRQAKGQLTSEDRLPADQAVSPVYPPELMEELLPFADQSSAMTLEELHYFLPADSADLERINRISNWDRTQRESVIKISYLSDKFFRLTTEYLLETQPFDLLLTYFFETDGIGHWMWPYREAEYFPEIPAEQVQRYKDVIDSTYVNMDRMLGSIMERVPDDCHVIIISDHGFGVEDYGGVYGVGHKKAPDGILMMKGPHFRREVEMNEKARLRDLTPTLLALLGIPVGEDMQGRVLTEVFEPEFLEQHPIRTIPSHDRGQKFRARATVSQEDHILKEKLRALGYIE